MTYYTCNLVNGDFVKARPQSSSHFPARIARDGAAHFVARLNTVTQLELWRLWGEKLPISIYYFSVYTIYIYLQLYTTIYYINSTYCFFLFLPFFFHSSSVLLPFFFRSSILLLLRPTSEEVVQPGEEVEAATEHEILQ